MLTPHCNIFGGAMQDLTHIMIMWQSIAWLELNNMVFVSRSTNMLISFEVEFFLNTNVTYDIHLHNPSLSFSTSSIALPV